MIRCPQCELTIPLESDACPECFVKLDKGVIIEETSSGGGGVPSGGGGGGLGEAALQQVFQTEETYDLVRGEDDFFVMKVENPFEYGPLTNVTLDVSGFLSQYIEVRPTKIDRIGIAGVQSLMHGVEQVG